jgi:DNA polymerase gamma 1
MNVEIFFILTVYCGIAKSSNQFSFFCFYFPGYPLHFIRGQGWGFLVPHKSSKNYEETDPTIPQLPLHDLILKCPVLESNPSATSNESDNAMLSLWRDVESKIGKKDYYSKAKKDNTNGVYKGTGVWCDIDLEECCWFFKLPHKDGGQHRVGNPLAKDFLNKFSENVLSGESDIAERIISIARMVSYWRNNRDRVMRQMVVWLANRNISRELRETGGSFGAIIPQVVVCGTLTRRAMEPTWMTASNAQTERVGSELRSMIQAPKGYRIVGADVDSQELWIASILGDAHACGVKHGSGCNLHGATPFGWMTLSGTKSSGTDMHSITAKAVGISRDHAKVINYARIYGAGMQFAERLLKQFNPTMSDGEAKSKAIKMFTITKGKKLYFLLPEYQNEYESKG